MREFHFCVRLNYSGDDVKSAIIYADCEMQIESYGP